MSRADVRQMKQAVFRAACPRADIATQAIAKESAIALLSRSIEFGHGRLAVLRLCMAAQVHAEIAAEQWRYCEAVVRKCSDPRLTALFAQARTPAFRRDAGAAVAGESGVSAARS